MEVYVNGHWSTVCDNLWDIDAATVVCRQLGYSGAIYGRKGSYYGQGSGRIEIELSLCNGTETSLLQCLFVKWGHPECDHKHDAGVTCCKSLR